LPQSMTGFATSEVASETCRLIWEIRSVNHRFLDPSFRLPDDLKGLDQRLRKQISDHVRRGKVDCTLRVVPDDARPQQSTADAAALADLFQLQHTVVASFPDARELSVAEILRWPGVVSEQSQRSESLVEPALEGFEQAIRGLAAAREREGERLAEILVGHLDATASLLAEVDEQLKAHAPQYRQKLLERLERLDVAVAPERLEQELALIAQRADVREEADRLRAHLAEIRDVLKRDEPIGRRLDFLIQELNREANTLASKVQDDELARRAVDLKVLIEQMREQVQNLE